MATKKIILCDTNIFIELFHENARIVQELDFLGFERLAISVVAAGEIYFGMRKREATKTKELVRRFNLYHLDKEISNIFIQLMLGYRDKGLSVPDALVAATALANNVELFTLNRSDFEFLKGVKLYNPKY